MVGGEQPLAKDFSCLTGDTIISTPYGSRKIKDIGKEKGKFILSTDNKFRKYHSIVSRGVKSVYKIKLSNGLTIKATDDHRFNTKDGMKEVKNLKIGDKCKVITDYHFSKYGTNDELYEMFGWMHGDGWMTNSGTVGISFNKKDGDFPHKERLLPLFKTYFDSHNIKPLKDDNMSYQLQITDNSKVIKKCKDLGFVFGTALEKELPLTFYNWNLEQQISFMRGLFASDGNIQGKNNGQIWLYSSSIKLIEQTQIFLSSIGIHTRQYTSTFKNSNRNPQYKLGISKKSSLIFQDVIGFNGHKKEDKYCYNNYKDEDCFEVKNIVSIGEEEVFDIMEVDKTNTFYANGIAVHNCDLGSINVSQLVENPYTKNAKFNFLKFEKAIKIGVEALDTLIDENADNHPLEAHKINSLNYRNIGLGVMGYATALFKLGIKYGSEECMQFTDKLFNFLFREAVIASNALARKKGTFPKYKDVIFDSTIIKSHFTEDEIKELKIYGLKNCSLISIAPTGSIATMLGITGGCEPEFALKFLRKTESLNDGEEKYYTVYCNAIQEYKTTNKTDLIPDYFVSSSDIKWIDRIKVQAVMQKHIDTAISSTINLPLKIQLKEIEMLYLEAWKQGLKGITIFRNGCKREGILTTKESKSNTEQEKQPTLNPLKWGDFLEVSDDLVGKKRKLMSGCGSLYVLAYFDPINGDLLEVFLNKGSQGVCLSNLNAVSRLISWGLRHGGSIETAIDQLLSVPGCTTYTNRTTKKKDTSKGSSCSSAIAYALKDMYNEMKEELFDDEEIIIENEIKAKKVKEIKNIPKEQNNYKCPECGESVQFSGGCVSCTACGYSKCD